MQREADFEHHLFANSIAACRDPKQTIDAGEYYIEAQLRQGRKVRRYLFVDSAPTIPSDPVPFLGQPVTRDAALLSPRGTLSFAGYVVDTRLGRDQTMEVCVAGRNDSNVEIKGIRIKMIETVIFSAHGAINRANTTGPPAVPPASYKVTLVQFPDVPPFEGMQKKSALGVLKERREGFSPRQEHYNAIRNELLTRENVIRVKIPKYAKDTFRGQTLECRHHLEVQIVVASFGVTPLITIPLSIGNPQEPTGPQIAIAVPSAPPAPLEEIDIPVEPSAPELFEQESNDYPIAVAVQLQPMDMRGISTRTPIAIAQSTAFIIGTHAVVVNNYDDNDEEEDLDYDNVSLQDTLLEVMPARIPRTPTFENLLQEMVSSVQDYDIISRKLADSAWMPIFSSLTPSQYGTIILHVNVAFDQPKVAVLVATSFDKESHPFTCEFLVQAVRNTEEWNRTVMVVTLSFFEQAMDARLKLGAPVDYS
eukprot:scaffold5824_cov54-Attheya_sp.AAC.1